VFDEPFETLQLIKSKNLNAARTPYYLETLDLPTDIIPGGIFITGGQHISISVRLSNENGSNEWMVVGIFVIGGQHIIVSICLSNDNGGDE